MADEEIRVEALVIGAGPGGYVAGIRLGQLKKKALVVERERHVLDAPVDVFDAHETFARDIEERREVARVERPELSLDAVHQRQTATPGHLPELLDER